MSNLRELYRCIFLPLSLSLSLSLSHRVGFLYGRVSELPIQKPYQINVYIKMEKVEQTVPHKSERNLHATICRQMHIN